MLLIYPVSTGYCEFIICQIFPKLLCKGIIIEDVLNAGNHILEEIKIYVQSNYHVVEMKLKPMYVISFIRKKMVSMNLMGIKIKTRLLSFRC